MANVFISYARADQGFVRDLNATLKKANLDTWIDWRSIPESAQWRAAIFAAIEAADNFLFIVSPDSLRSSICRQEVAHAVANAKRIITILYHRVDRNDLFPGIAEIHWIDYPELGSKETFKKLKTAISVDLDWLRMHTQFGLRAAQWEQNGRDNGFLLHGKELREAIRWLERAPTINSSKPTQMHEQYIRASEDWAGGEIERLRALNDEKERQRCAAEKNLSRALEQERISLSRHLAAESEIARREPDLLELSALLGIEALRRQDIPEAETALRNALQYLPEWVAVISDPSPIRIVRFSPNSRYIAMGTELPGMMTGEFPTAVRIFRVDGFTEVGCVAHIGFVKDLAFSSDSKILATIGAEPCCRLIRVEDATPLTDIPLSSRQGAVGFSPDTNLLVLSGDDGQIQAFDITTLEKRWTQVVRASIWQNTFSPNGEYLGLSGQDGRCRLLAASTGQVLFDQAACQQWGAFTNSGNIFVSGSLDGSLVSLEAGTWKVLGARQQDSAVAKIVFTRDDRYLVSCSTDGMVRVFEPNLKLKSWFYSGQKEVIMDLATSPNNRYVGLACGNTTRVLQVDTGREIFRTCHEGMVRSISFSPDGQYFAVGGRDHRVRIFRSTENNETLSFEHLGRLSTPTTFSPGRRRIVTAVEHGPLFVFDAVSGKELRQHRFEGTAAHVAVGPDDSALVFADDTRKAVCAFDIERNEEIWKYVDTTQSMNGLSFSPNGKYVAAVGWNNITILSAYTGQRLWQLDAGQVPVAAAFSSSHMLATAGADSKSYFFDCLSGERTRTIDYGASGSAIAFNHDDSLVATARGDGTIWISSVSNGETVQRIANVGLVFSIALNGNMIATAGKDRSARIFDLLTGRQVWRIDLQSTVWRVSFGPGLISTTEGLGLLKTHQLDREIQVQKACSRLSRNLSDVEWRRYFGDEPYRETRAFCPSQTS